MSECSHIITQHINRTELNLREELILDLKIQIFKRILSIFYL